MEVVDSHMSEQFSAHTPAHIDVDMSAEYDDDAEYAMHDVTEATTTNDANDEEIYDAEFEEVPEHTEIEMDEYADEVEVVEDDETHMGTYVPTDDAATATDITVEDVQLRSSPVPQGTTIRSISPHVSVDAELPLSEAPVGALADHSPHSVATLVGDSEIEHLPADTTEEDHLNGVVDLTENGEVSQIVSVDAVEDAPSVNPTDSTDQTVLQSHRDVTQDDLDEAEQEFYDVEESVAELHSTNPNAPDQLVEQQEPEQPEQQGEEQHPEHTSQHERLAETPVYLEIPEQTDQSGHSPIEEALVINQQVRDDAADSMEPSPPVRLYYRDEGKGTDEVFDIFTSTGLESSETILLFHDNRTLFYEPLSTFFARLRETEYFSGDRWDNWEMGLRMDLGNSSVLINEDHKETDNISLFKLSFMWSGFGVEEPLELTLVRLSERLVVQLTRLVENIEQRDFHNEDATERPESQHEAGIGGPDINPGGVENDENDSSKAVSLENSNQPGAPINPNGIPGDISRGTHESEGTQALDAAQPDGLDEQRQGADGDDEIETTQGVGANRRLEERTQDIPTQDRDPTTRVDYQGTETEGTVSSAQNDDDNTLNHGQSPSSSTPKPQEDEYDEYEEGESNPAPTQTLVPNGESGEGWDANEYDYEEDYDGANSDEEHSKRTLPGSVPDEPTDSDHVSPNLLASKSQGPKSLQNSGLKRNLDELEYEEYETPSAPSSPGSEYKRLKQHT